MILQSNPEVPTPFITPAQLNAFINKPVIIVGKVMSMSDASLVLQGGDKGTVTVARARPAQVVVEMGMNVMVRGVVNQDLSIAESNSFPATDLGETFDFKLYNDAAAVTSHMNYVHMFTN